MTTGTCAVSRRAACAGSSSSSSSASPSSSVFTSTNGMRVSASAACTMAVLLRR